jgi:predicted transcriptional regulator
MRRVTVTFTDDAYAALEELARRRGTSMAEVLRDAIAREKWFEDEVRGKGSHLLIEEGGNVRELVFAR